MISVRIQSLQWIGGAIVAATCLLLGGSALIVNLKDYYRYERGAEELQRFHSVMVVANAVSAERGPANSVMGTTEAIALVLADALASKRATTDAQIELLLADKFNDLDSVHAGVQQLRAGLTAGRAAVDAVAAKPRPQRTGTEIADAIKSMFAAADSAAQLRDNLGQTIISLTPQVSTEIILGTAVSEMREEEGRLGSYVVMMLTSPLGEDAQHYTDMEESAARLQQIRALLTTHAAAYFNDPAIEPALAAVDLSFFRDTLSYARQTATSDGYTNTLSASQFTARYVPGMVPSENLRELITSLSMSKVGQMRDAAYFSVLLSAALTSFTILVLLGLAVIFRSALFEPLIIVREQVIAIARGDLSEPLPRRQIGREIRQMFDGLNVLREQQREKARLEHSQRNMTEQLKTLSETDTLTGLPNRRALTDAATRIFVDADRQNETVAILVLDIDHFKAVNDTFGHAVGDIVLQQIGHLLSPLLRPSDMMARYGGEEFIILLRGVDEAQMITIAERLRTTLASAMVSAEHDLRVTGSFGAALRLPGSYEDWDSVIAVADRRLYAAKRSGRNRVCWNDLPARPARALA